MSAQHTLVQDGGRVKRVASSCAGSCNKKRKKCGPCSGGGIDASGGGWHPHDANFQHLQQQQQAGAQAQNQAMRLQGAMPVVGAKGGGFKTMRNAAKTRHAPVVSKKIRAAAATSKTERNKMFSELRRRDNLLHPQNDARFNANVTDVDPLLRGVSRPTLQDAEAQAKLREDRANNARLVAAANDAQARLSADIAASSTAALASDEAIARRLIGQANASKNALAAEIGGIPSALRREGAATRAEINDLQATMEQHHRRIEPALLRTATTASHPVGLAPTTTSAVVAPPPSAVAASHTTVGTPAPAGTPGTLASSLTGVLRYIASPLIGTATPSPVPMTPPARISRARAPPAPGAAPPAPPPVYAGAAAAPYPVTASLPRPKLTRVQKRELEKQEAEERSGVATHIARAARATGHGYDSSGLYDETRVQALRRAMQLADQGRVQEALKIVNRQRKAVKDPTHLAERYIMSLAN